MDNQDNSRFSFKFLGATMEAMNLRPNSFIKIFWHLALIGVFIMTVVFLLDLARHYCGI